MSTPPHDTRIRELNVTFYTSHLFPSFHSRLSAVRPMLWSMKIISWKKANDIRTHQSRIRPFDYSSPADNGGRGHRDIRLAPFSIPIDCRTFCDSINWNPSDYCNTSLRTQPIVNIENTLHRILKVIMAFSIGESQIFGLGFSVPNFGQSSGNNIFIPVLKRTGWDGVKSPPTNKERESKSSEERNS